MTLTAINFKWKLDVGDPDMWSWLITFTYFTCFFITLYSYKKLKNLYSKQSLFSHKLTIYLLLFLGLNKQLDIQVLVNDYAGYLLNTFELRSYKYHILTVAMIIMMTIITLVVYHFLKNSKHQFNNYLMVAYSVLFIFISLKIIFIYKGDFIAKLSYNAQSKLLKSLESFSLLLIFHGQFKLIRSFNKTLSKKAES